MAGAFVLLVAALLIGSLVRPELPIEATRVLPMRTLRADRVTRAALADLHQLHRAVPFARDHAINPLTNGRVYAQP